MTSMHKGNISSYFTKRKKETTEDQDNDSASSSSSQPPSIPTEPSTTTSPYFGKRPKKNYDDNMKELAEKGYTVIKGVLSEEKCDKYYKALWDWLASLGTGIDFSDSKTWTSANWPIAMHGILQHYSVGQEQFVWDVRCEPEIIDVFEAIWGTRRLLVSFDGLNISKPNASRSGHKWYHTDQRPGRLDSPWGTNFRMHKALQASKAYCIQGSLNLLPNGELDGGFAAMEGSHKMHEQFFKANPKAKAKGDWYKLEATDYTFFNGCKEVKVCCDPGDVILWDSRTMHMAYIPQQRMRSVIYVCYMPAEMSRPKDLAKKKEAFTEKRMTSHWPCAPKLFPKNPRVYDKEQREKEYKVSTKLPELSDLGKKLAGIMDY